MIGTVLPCKPRIIRLQLQFFSRCCVGINYCNVTLHFYRIWCFGKYVIVLSPLVNLQGCSFPEEITTTFPGYFSSLFVEVILDTL